MRRFIIVLITFLAGLYFFLEFILPEVIPSDAKEGEGFRFARFDEEISIAFTAVGTMAFALGAVSILRSHGGSILRKRKGWTISVILIVSMFCATGIEFFMWRARSETAGVSKRFKELAAAQEIIVSSAKTPPVPPYMKDWPQDRIPAELRRVATLEERAGAQEKLVAAIHGLREERKGEAEGAPGDLAAKIEEARASAEAAAGAGLSKLKAGAEAEAAADLTQSLTLLQKAAEIQRDRANRTLETSRTKRVHDLLWEGFFNALGSAMFSLLAFYIATAAYRAFRLQSKEAFLLMFAALLVMLGQIPVGVKVADFLLGPLGDLCGIDHFSITQVRLWMLKVVNTAAFRGIALGSAMAGLSMAWRVWWSMESSALLDTPGGSEKENGNSKE